MSDDIKWAFGRVEVHQSVTVSYGAFLLITTFADRDVGEFRSESTVLPFSRAAQLDDKEWRRDVAWEHVERHAEKMRLTLASIDAAVATRAARSATPAPEAPREG